MQSTDVTVHDEAVSLLDSWAAESGSGLMAHRLVIDRLLDLRNLLSSDERRFLVDATLVDLPGRSVVDSAWWHERVRELRLLITDPPS